MTDHSVSLIITTYNWPEALNACLRSVLGQTIRVGEVLIADDGSEVATQGTIKHWGSKLNLIHCWVPDTANRPAVIRNRAAARATGDTLIFIDGDCVLAENFVHWHAKLSSPNTIVSGGRVLLSSLETFEYLGGGFLSERVSKNFKFRELQLGFLRDLINNSIATVRTCNMSIMKEDFVKCSGFDESYVGWAREDTDFVIRAVRSGIKIRSGRCACNMFHLYHGGDKGRVSPNDHRLNALTLDRSRVQPIKSMFNSLDSDGDL